MHEALGEVCGVEPLVRGVVMDCRLTLEPVASSAGVARSVVADRVRACGWGELVEDAQLLTSELVTNAAVHTGEPFTVRIACGDHRLRVEVSDRSATRPERGDAGPTDVHGRGLAIVDSLASRWGVDELRADGKTVWFELAASTGTA